jgi:hypothetical protein
MVRLQVAGFLPMPEFHLGIDYLGHVLFLDKVNNLIDPGVQQLGVITHQGHPQLGLLPQVVVVHFGHGGVEAVPDLFNQAFNNFAFPLERMIIGQMQGYSSQGNDHDKKWRSAFSNQLSARTQEQKTVQLIIP